MNIGVNGITLYYEQTGSGPPVILLHGNGEDHSIFDMLVGELSGRFLIYTVDSRGHGSSTKTQNLDYRVMADDIAQMIDKLNIAKPALLGFSDGGILGLILASRYPDMLSKLIVCGANTHPVGIRTTYLVIMKLACLLTKNERLKLMVRQPDITDFELQSILIPTLVLAGNRDLIKPKHTEHIASLIPNARLHILKGESHSSYIVHSPKLAEIIVPFLKETD